MLSQPHLGLRQRLNDQVPRELKVLQVFGIIPFPEEGGDTIRVDVGVFNVQVEYLVLVCVSVFEREIVAIDALVAAEVVAEFKVNFKGAVGFVGLVTHLVVERLDVTTTTIVEEKII